MPTGARSLFQIDFHQAKLNGSGDKEEEKHEGALWLRCAHVSIGKERQFFFVPARFGVIC